MATPAGQAAMQASQKKSEEAYQKAVELDPGNAAAHRGLGFLYEKQRLPAQCAGEFREYLELAPNALDQLQIRRRLESAEKESAPPVTTNAAPSPKP
jgi:regulator of sirC expression with transglutaminase-like and TPR domain